MYSLLLSNEDQEIEFGDRGAIGFVCRERVGSKGFVCSEFGGSREMNAVSGTRVAISIFNAIIIYRNF